MFSADAARGLDALRRFEAGKYKKELLVCYVPLQSMDAVLLTDKHLAVMQMSTLEPRFKLKISEVSGAATKGNSVLVSVKPPSASSTKYLTEALGVTTAVRERVLAVGDLEKAEYLVSSISACCQAATQP